MTISSTVRIAGPFTGNGVTTTFPFSYKVFSTADVQVIRLTISTGIETTLTLVTDYNITLNGDQDSNPGGNIVMVTPLLALYKLTATSDIANLQPTDLTNQGGFYPEVITDALDRATIQIQQISDIGDRTLKIPISDGALNMELPTAASRANSFLAFGATGLPTVVTAGSSGAPTTMTRQNFSGTGSQVAFTLASDPGALGNSAEVFIGGVYQNRTTYTISGTTLTFSAAPVLGTDNIEFVNFLTDAIGSTSADLVTYTPAGTGAVARSAQSKMRDTVSVKDFGAVGDGVTDDTAAINAALATKKSVYFPSGTYMTTGGHVIPYVNETTDQTIFGDAAFSTIIKKISGTLAVFDFRQFVHTSIKDLTIDGNGLAGVGIMWRSHNAIIDHIIIKNVADYAIWISGSNLCNYYNISTFVCSGGIKFDSVNDPISVPTYACLYSNFHGISLDINAVNFSALSLASGMVQLVLFSGVHIEPTFVTANTASYVNITGVNTSNITFENVRAELSLLGTSFFNITGVGVHSIKFDKCRISATQQSAPLFAANATYGISIIDCSFYAGETLANFPVASPRIKLTNVVNATIQGCITSFKDAFVFIETILACQYITESNNSSLPWVYGSWTVTPAVNGSNTWSDTSLNIKCENGGFAQNHSTALFSITKSNNENDFNTSINRATTIADDSYYDLFGDGGTTNLGSNFLALVTIAAGNQTTLNSINNFAMLYISCSSSSGVAFASSMLGSNVEVDLMTTTASLADTTDGRLGVQIGDAVPTTERYVRIYNRTGVALLLNLKIENMDRS